MLKAKPGSSQYIGKVYRKNHSLFLEQEKGLIRIIPQNDKIIRVSYTENGEFSTLQGEELEDLSSSCEWQYEENGEEICIKTDFLRVKIKRNTGSIRYEKADGSLLFAEADKDSKQVDAFQSYKTIINENTQVQEIETPDGVKKKIQEADKIIDKKLYHTRLSMKFASDEKLYGLGQAEEGVWNLRHTTQYLHQANLKIAIPFLLSSKGYGILLSTQSPVIFSDVQYGSWLYTEADEYLDYYFIAGTCLDQVVYGFRSITGQAVMLPRWAFGYIQSQERYETEEEIVETAETFRKRGIGLDAIVLDWHSWKGEQWGQKTFDEERFPNPAAMISSLHEKHVRFMISIWPKMDESSDNYQEFQRKGLLLPASGIYDAFREEGRRLYWAQANAGLFCHGVDAWWCDASEPVDPEWGRAWKPEPGDMYREFLDVASHMMPIQKSNAYGLYHARTMYEGQREKTEEKRVVNLTRSGYPGSQKYGTILWSGDIYASWETLKRQIAAGLHYCASGLPYWTLDIGAFFVKKGKPWFWKGEYEEGTTDFGYRELYVRWFQYGAFLPIFRSHGTDCRREPWNFGEPGEPFYEAILSAIRLRYRLLPYIYSLAGDVWRNHQTMMRLLTFDFPDDETSTDISDEYMFGPALLVCPITEPMFYLAGSIPIDDSERSRTVYLPSGTVWYDFYTNEAYGGGQYITVAAEIDSIPVFVRAGSILPTKEAGESTDQMEGTDTILQIYAGADGEFTLYEDAGDGYGYENGEYCLTTVNYRDEDRSVEWKSDGKQEFRRGNIRVNMIG